MLIRPETVADYTAIGDVHSHAFGNQVGVPALLALLRQGERFDPELSLVAEVEGRVVGHVLFTPQHMRLLGGDVPAVMLSPLGVLPDFQSRGVGTALVQEGHRVATAKGFAVSWLLGVPAYYPRFGYRQQAYGSWTLTVEVPETSTPLEEAAVTCTDIGELQRLWRIDQSDVDFAAEPGSLLTDWVSPNTHIQSLVFREGGEVVGFAMYDDRHQDRPHALLARDGTITMGITSSLARRTHVAELHLPLHPNSSAARGLLPPTLRTIAPQMAASLAPGALDEYLALVDSVRRPLGQTGWLTAVDLAD